MYRIAIYDTTLRDGTQAEELNLTTEDKVRIAHKLDELGVHYIEGGWPGSNPTDRHFFDEIASHQFRNSSIAAFGSTYNPKATPETDPIFQSLLDCGADVLTIFGKTWDLHAELALGIDNDRNVELIRESVAYLRPNVRELFFDAEHFFDGFRNNPEFALDCVQAAHEAGADVLVLCDTNGGSLPHQIAEAVKAVTQRLPEAKLGIHAHNDGELAVANSLEAIRHGAVQVQGTMNGYGERCGNANLCSIIPNLELKLGYESLGPDNMARLTEVSHYISEIANLRPFMRQPFVGASAFAHKGGVHVSAVRKDSRTYEHIRPEAVGNVQRVLLSDLAGRSNLLHKAEQFGHPLEKGDPRLDQLIKELKQRESMGFEYSVAEASFELMFHKIVSGRHFNYFKFRNFFVVDAKREEDSEPFSEATVMVHVGDKEEHTAATGMGPVNALDRALRKGLERFYPCLEDVRLLDFKVRVLSGAVRDTGGTASFVRVLVESGDSIERWTTVGVSHNIIEASWQAVVDSYNYKLFREDMRKIGH
ncbi:citramalate synthase [Salidesulfovibrio brasiliensis]|uniref:citramalate synthase n=1 Tax=Salidesulfovibrio brasiliensis TaxID=221711 RepID=UPI0006D22CD2|nr:citramalate synthase [Salidesulfovibrio brasiliensis]